MQKKSSKASILLITGPTASGKSELALDILDQAGLGCVVNADSMQVYKGLEIITASPAKCQMRGYDHHLYNFLSPDQDFSAACYAARASDLIKKLIKKDQPIIITGGSGMYIKTLLCGHSPIPDISPEMRLKARSEFNAMIMEDIRSKLVELAILDEQKASRVDRQRATRIYEVYLQTAKPIDYFWNQPNTKYLPDVEIKKIGLLPQRDFLYQICNERTEKIFDAGGAGEVEALLKKEILPAKKIIGFDEIAKYIKGEITKQDALSLMQARTRQYAKRQVTWLRHQINMDYMIEYSSAAQMKSRVDKIFG